MNDLLFDAEGKRYVDLHCSFGAVFMGHCHAGITQALVQQASALWTGGFSSDPYREAAAALERALGGYATAGIYSTGMEACEFALRASRVATGKSGWIGFGGSMHGKSIATAALGWSSVHGEPPADCVRLPFPEFAEPADEDAVLAQVRAALATRPIGALWIEPLLGSSGGRGASPGFYRAVQSLAREHGAWLVVDEILTGFYRTGERFRFEALGLAPDVVLVGKACGNGFPVSAVMLTDGREVDPRMMPGSTYAGNALAAATLSATVQHLLQDGMQARVAAMAQVVRDRLGWLDDSPFSLRGMGAMWVIEARADHAMQDLVARLCEQGVWVSGFGRQIRLLPCSTSDLSHLDWACNKVTEALRSATASA